MLFEATDDGQRPFVLCFDVEDNFTRQELVDDGDWERFEGQIVENTSRVLRLLGDLGVEASFFVVSCAAERHPEVVRMIVDGGHHLCSHGHNHIPVDQLGPEGFRDDLQQSLDVLGRLSGDDVDCHRARSCSINFGMPWAFDILRLSGVRIDSSVFRSEVIDLVRPGTPENDARSNEAISEYPTTSFRLRGREIGGAGGLAFRLLPLPVLHRLLLRTAPVADPVVSYFHVWEFNRDQPRRKVGRLQRLSQSPHLFSTEQKIRRLASSFRFMSIREHEVLYGPPIRV